MQPIVPNRKYYEESLFSSLKMIEAHLQKIGFQVDRVSLCKVIKSVETPSLEVSAMMAAGLYNFIRTPAWKNDLLFEAKQQEEAGMFPRFMIEDGAKKYVVPLQRVAPTDNAWNADRPERL